jgi:MFS family permease
MNFRRPYFLNQLPTEAGVSLARLSAFEGFSRAILVGVLPLIALQVFGNKETIATVYFISSIFTLIFTVNIARLERWLQRRRLVTLGGVFLIVSVVFLYSGNALFFALGTGLRAAGASVFSVCLSLYIMDYIGKKELTRNESRRMIYNGTAWLIAPALGGWIYSNAQPVVIFVISAGMGIVMLVYFWRLWLGDDKVVKHYPTTSQNPIRAIGRFASQPRLRIAYLVTLSRACFWATLFVYAPIYIIEANMPAFLGGILLSGASGLLFFSPFVQRLADRFGTRQVLIGCSVLIGFSMVGLGIIGVSKPIGLVFWITGALGAGGMDVLGNIPFMRMVRTNERSEMTMVFTTWREASSLVTQALVFLTLLVAPFWVFYFVLGALQFVTAFSTSFLPRRL